MTSSPFFLHVRIAEQTLGILKNGHVLQTYRISTGKRGTGQLRNSEQTPLGLHTIRAKIGENAPINTVFVGRRPTGEIFTPALRTQHPGRDWILTRIFWLSGLELGKNRLGMVDTMRRYIYIHGAPDDVPMGMPGSKGCIRMRNSEIIALFKIIPIGTKLLIE